MSSTNAPFSRPLRAVPAVPVPARGAVAGLGALVLATATLLPSCNDNVSCVLTSGCRDGGGLGDAGAAARLPEQNEWIKDGPPTIEAVRPDGGFVAGTSPIVLVFDESMNLATLADAFQLVPILNGLEGPPVPLPVAALVGDGRVLVLFPPARLEAGEYLLFTTDDAELRDITGQVADVADGVQLGSFGVDVTDPVDVQVVGTYPIDASDGQSPTGEVVVVFDRPAQDSTVTSASLQVTIDGEEPPADPEPEALVLQQGGINITDQRVYRWRSVDDEGVPAPLPLDGQVLVEVSPAGDEISDSTGAIVQPFVFSYELLPFARPLDVTVLSQPADAIGAANLTPGDPEELLIQVDLVGAEEGDFLDLFLFGTSLEDEPRTIALSRELELTDPSPVDVAFYDRGAVDLTMSIDPLEARFADGAVSFAFRLRRGLQRSTLTVLDVDPQQDGIQDPLLDTTGPVVSEFFYAGDGGTTFVRSDQRDIVVGGRANEFVRAVEVVSQDFGDNGMLPGVIGVAEDGLFVAAPIPAGVLPPADVTLDLVTYDAAFNASDPFTVTFRQVGAVGPTGFTPGDPVTVEVYDALTLAPVEGALVLTHGDEGDGATYPFADAAATDAEGRVTLGTAGGASVEALVTVDAPGYDLFTFHGITSARVSLPLNPTGTDVSATVQGEVTASDPGVSLIINLIERRMGDSRRPLSARPLYPVGDCTTDPFGTGESSCPYGPEPVRPGRPGVQTFLAGSFMQPQGALLIEALLQAFDIQFPLDVLAPGDASVSMATVPFLLIDEDVPPNELPREFLGDGGARLALSLLGISGIDLGDLVTDPDVGGDPFVTVEAIAPGYPGSFPVGIGQSFPSSATSWDLRAGYAGAVSEGGFFGMNGLVDPDVFLKAEVRDAAGARVVSRVRASRVGSLPLGGDVLIPVGAPTLAAPAPGGSSGGDAFDLVFDDTLIDLYGIPGLYRATLEDEGGRRWTLWRFDRLNGPMDEARIHVPDPADGGGVGLVDGTVRTRLGIFAVPGLDPTSFLWSDLEREYELAAEAAPVTFQKP